VIIAGCDPVMAVLQELQHCCRNYPVTAPTTEMDEEGNRCTCLECKLLWDAYDRATKTLERRFYDRMMAGALSVAKESQGQR